MYRKEYITFAISCVYSINITLRHACLHKKNIDTEHFLTLPYTYKMISSLNTSLFKLFFPSLTSNVYGCFYTKPFMQWYEMLTDVCRIESFRRQ